MRVTPCPSALCCSFSWLRRVLSLDINARTNGMCARVVALPYLENSQNLLRAQKGACNFQLSGLKKLNAFATIATLRSQVPNNHILTQNLYYSYYYPKPKYLIIGYLDPLGKSVSEALILCLVYLPSAQKCCVPQPLKRPFPIELLQVSYASRLIYNPNITPT